MLNSRDTLITYENQRIDLGNYTGRKIDRLFEDAVIDSGKVILNKSLLFKNCVLMGRGFRDLKLNRLIIQNSSSESKENCDEKANQVQQVC